MAQIWDATQEKLIDRPNWRVWATLLGSAAGICITGGFAGFAAGAVTVGGTIIPTSLGIVGMGLGGIVVGALRPYVFINNDLATMFVTIDKLRSLFQSDDVYVAYGTGAHPCYPWEERRAGNSVILKESSQEFNFRIQCPDGVLFCKGSFRLRPDQNNPITFLTGVAAVAADLVDLIIVQAVEYLAGLKVTTATKRLALLNDTLRDYFAIGTHTTPTDFEKRFGVTVGDVTVSEIMPSDETQRTIAALTEAAVIKQGTAMILGMSMKAVAEGVKNGTLNQATVERARKDFMSVSGNLEGVTVDRKEFALEGLDHLSPETIATLALLAKQFFGSNNQTTKKGRK